MLFKIEQYFFIILTRKYGYFKSIWLVPLYLGTVMVGKINDDYGFLMGYFNYMNIQTKDAISGDKVKYLLHNNMSSNAQRGNASI